MRVSVLSSGSSGNCFYIENDDSAVLIDVGISCRKISERLFDLGKNTEKIKGIFITHEHSDHIKGADVFARTFNIPIFATRETARNCFLCSNEKLVNEIKNNEIVDLHGIKIEAFSKSHKAVDPVSYNLFNGKKVSIITDVGYASKAVSENIEDSDCLCLESNHDIKMLENGPYPYFLKKWILSDIGHLSNNQAGLCVMEHAKSKLKNIILSHLSETNNTPELALKSLKNFIKERNDLKPRVFVSTKFMATELVRV